MNDNYHPDTFWVREGYVSNCEQCAGQDPYVASEEFDRWLTAEFARVWADGRYSADDASNPYVSSEGVLIPSALDSEVHDDGGE